MKEKWVAINRKQEFERLSKETKLHPLMIRLLANRGIKTGEEASLFLNGTLKDLHDGTLMKDMNKGVSIIKDAILNKKKIAIYGDYDCDGVCSTTILYKTLQSLGADFKYHIPNREDEGYGMNSNRVKKLKDEGVEVILTCDNGIAAMEEVKLAKELGMTVVITDHHDIPYVEEDGERKTIIPEGDAVINPKQDNSYPFKELCGAGIALKFSEQLVKAMGGNFQEFKYLYQFAAMATVCDVVELLDENRIIVKEGLKIINSNPNKGLNELIKVSKLEGKTIGEYHFGFVLGPCVNATGRLETADLSVELLITEDDERAKELAARLHELNSRRQEMTEESVERVLEKIKCEKREEDKVILVYDENIHESIAGIVAGRVREYLPLLKKAILSKCSLTDEDIIPVIKIDSPIPIERIDESLVNDIESLRPFGKGNSSPLLGAKNLNVTRVFFMGKEGRFMKFRFKNSLTGGYVDGINFDKYEAFKEEFIDKYGEEKFFKLQDDGYGGFNMDIIYYPAINEFNGNRTIQLNIKAFRL